MNYYLFIYYMKLKYWFLWFTYKDRYLSSGNAFHHLQICWVTDHFSHAICSKKVYLSDSHLPFQKSNQSVPQHLIYQSRAWIYVGRFSLSYLVITGYQLLATSYIIRVTKQTHAENSEMAIIKTTIVGYRLIGLRRLQ